LHLFYEINGWAGRIEWLDASLRFFYVGVTPFLATLLAALICLRPQRESILVVRRGIILSSLLSVALSIAVMLGINLFQQTVLGGTPICARPFMTHWANLLVVEPNGNSFPCFEVMFAAGFAMLIWAKVPRWALLAWPLVLLLGFARIFCGSNYPGDVLAGTVLGATLSILALSLCHVTVPLGSSSREWRWSWSPRRQGAIAALVLTLLAIAGGAWLWNSPGHGSRVHALLASTSLGQSMASAAPSMAMTKPASISGNIHEGEGGSTASAPAAGEMLLDSKAARLDGHLPGAEMLLHTVLGKLQLRHRLLGINIAQVRAGTTAYRSAAVRFEVDRFGAQERTLVGRTAARIVRAAFLADAQLQHVDVLGVALQPSYIKPISFSSARTLASEVPVFTASVERKDLVIHQDNKPAWINDSNHEGGAWLRARSLLYIDQKLLPSMPELTPVVSTSPAVKPKPVAARPTPFPASNPWPRAQVRVKPKPKTQSKPITKAKPKVFKPKVVRKPSIKLQHGRKPLKAQSAQRHTAPVLQKHKPRPFLPAKTVKKNVQKAPSRDAAMISGERSAQSKYSTQRKYLHQQRAPVQRKRYRRGSRWRMRRDRNGHRYKAYY
jgi:undecaprenyl-diphosphatase